MNTPIEVFSEEEKEILSLYVSNTNRSVFVLTNLPEVIKGALFSRYSRSKLGLRSLLLKEFIQKKESQFDQIQGGDNKQKSSKNIEMAIESAKNFYDRILDGYGDDSIGELGGAHLALENISILATKTLEDSRIGGSPLEKSTRYVNFSDKNNGEYQFYKEPKLLKSDHRKLFLETCSKLFDTYVHCIEPIRDHVRKCLPRDSKISQNAYERSVRARGFDITRGLLPAATLTNMGVFGNGRFFETLISKLNVDSLLELREIGQQSLEELNKVIPSFLRRADTKHRHFQDFNSFDLSQKEFVNHIAHSQLGKLKPDKSELVTLIDFDSEAENKVIAALIYPNSSLPLQQIRENVRNISDSEKFKLIKKASELRKHRRHKPDRGLELAFYTFDILGDYGMYRDLQRHRMLSQARQPLSTRFGYDTPFEIEDAGLGKIYHEAMTFAADAFEKIFKDFPQEAQYVVPMSYNIRWNININLRALIWMTEIRSTPQGHIGYRRIAQEMFRKVKEVHPALAEYMKFVDLSEYSLGRLNAEQSQENKEITGKISVLN